MNRTFPSGNLSAVFASIASVIGLALFVCTPCADAQPTVIPRVASAPYSATHTFDVLRRYLSEPVNGFKIVSEDAAAHKIVAKRADIDTETWNQWAYCKVSPTHLLDTIQGNSATVTVSIEPSGKSSSAVKVSADLTASYALGSNETTAQCVSNGALENQIFAAAGAQPQTSKAQGQSAVALH